MKKKLLSLLLTGALCLSLSAPALAAGLENFQKTNAYTAGQFTDVPAGEWYAANVQAAYELGLMEGSSATTFNPYGNLTIAEALVLACRLHSTYVGDGAAFVGSGGAWYQPYVDYAIQNGILAAGTYSDYTATATRAQFASILAAALPAEALTAINSVTTLPDVAVDASYTPAVLSLYNAGVLTGSDSAGSFKPDTTIQRSEVATIVTRMADPSLRRTFTLTAGTTQPEQTASSTKRFDGPITAEDLQGTWYAHRDPGGRTEGKAEWIFDGNQCSYVLDRTYNGTYYYLTGTYTVASEPLNGDANIHEVTLTINYGDCYVNYPGEDFQLNDTYSHTTRTKTFNAILNGGEDCFIEPDGSTYYRADTQTVYPAYLAAFNESGMREAGETDPTIFAFLANYIQTNGHEVAYGDYRGQYEVYLDLYQTLGTNKDWTYSAYYDPASDQIALVGHYISSWGGENFTSNDSAEIALILPSDLAQPYRFTYLSSGLLTGVFGDLLFEPSEMSAEGHLDPATFTRDTEALAFSDAEGYRGEDIQDMAEENCASLLKIILQALNQDILHDNGYDFRDLGFDVFYY